MSEPNVADGMKRFGVEVNNLVELQSSTPAHRQFRFKFKAKGFVFWAGAEQTENGWVVTWPWPKVCHVTSIRQLFQIWIWGEHRGVNTVGGDPPVWPHNNQLLFCRLGVA